MKKVLLCGANGKMGNVIFSCLKEREDLKVVAGVDINTEPVNGFPVYKTAVECEEKIDVIIDYSHPSSLDGLLEYAVKNNIPVVIATTGYNPEQIKKIEDASKLIPVFFSFNMSLGINLLAELAKKAASFLGDQFDIEIVEKHHNRKLDAPSGTALLLADAINEEVGNSKEYVYDRHSVRKKREKKEIGISSIRGGTIVGEHEIIFAGHDEIITLSHTAMSREIFAVGSINAAAFMVDCDKAGIYRMSDLL